MDDEPPKSAAVPSSTDTTMTESPPKYVPQFSAATEMILKRINSGAGSSNLSSIGVTGTPPGYEDMRRSVLMNMKTSMNMEIPSTPVASAGSRARTGGTPKSAGSAGRKARATPTAASSVSGSASGKGKAPARARGKAGSKRKRFEEEDESESEEEDSDIMSKLGGDSDSDGSESFSELPKITQSGRQVNKPAQFVPSSYEAPTKKRNQPKRSQDQAQALCQRCSRGHSPDKNMIVFCDGCNLGWHQLCHDPNISEDTVKDESAPWFCADCGAKRGVKSAGVSWQGRSADDKRAYFNSLPYQQLVSLLIQTTILYPNAPIFPATSNRQSNHAHTTSQPKANPSRPNHSKPKSQAEQTFSPTTVPSGLFQRTDGTPTASVNLIRKVQAGSGSPQSAISSVVNNGNQHVHASSGLPAIHAENGDIDSRESTPASPPYPKPGNGLMAKLGPDDEDAEWLVDEFDSDAFSHTFYGQDDTIQVDEHGSINVAHGP